jgi:transcriptional regulator with XRE-family HTH domain
MNTDFGAAIQLTRENVKWTQKDLAFAVGLDPSTINRIESGKQTASLQTATVIAEALGLKLSRLITIAEAIANPADKIRKAQHDLYLSVQPLLQMEPEIRRRATERRKPANAAIRSKASATSK